MTDSLRVLVVDDEPLARRKVIRLLKDAPGVEIVGVCGSGVEAIEAIERDAPDLVFLDVQMPELDGFGVLEAVGPERMPRVIFVTAFDQYALKAFEVHALDYLMKPYDRERFEKALQRARAQIERDSVANQSQHLIALLQTLTQEQQARLDQNGAKSASKYLERLMVRSSGHIFFLKVPEIDWMEAAGNYIRIHSGKDSYLIRETMNSMEEKLDPDQFVRIHRSTIVNLDCIEKMQLWFGGDYMVILRDTTELKLSRGYREKLEERLGKPF
jgi:two-component system, LytTR family, response regulator